MEQKHFIGKLTLDVAAPASADGGALQNAASRLIWDELAPSLERLFDGLAPAGETISIGRLDVSLRVENAAGGLPDFAAAVVRAIAERLEKAIYYPSASDAGVVAGRRGLPESRFAAWIYFLTTGEQPETAAAEAEWRAGALETVASDARALGRLKALLRENPTAAERLVLQHDEPFLVQLAEAISGSSSQYLPQLRRRLFVFFSHPTVARWLENPPARSERATEVFFQAAIFKRLAASAEKWDEPQWTEFLIEQYCFQVARRSLLVLLSNVAAAAMLRAPSSLRPEQGRPIQKDAPPLAAPEATAAFFAEQLRQVETRPALRALKIGDEWAGFFDRAVRKAAPELAAEWAKRPPFAAAPPPASPPTEKPVSGHMEKTGDPAAPPPLENAAAPPPLKPAADFTGDPNVVVLPPPTAPAEAENDRPALPEPESAAAVEKKAAAADMLNKDKATATAAGKEIAAAEKSPDETKIADAARQENLPTGQTPDETAAADFAAADETIIETAAGEPSGKTYIVANAGVVLLHPFLAPYFEAAGLLKDGKFPNRAAQKRAVQLLHYLATGETDVPEYALPLAKALAGLPMSATVDRRLILTGAEREESDKLLKTVVKYWTALGDVGVDSLRQGFLIRNGRLADRDGDWLLTPERQTIDILLDRLPWGFGVVRLSWMRAFLYVEWS